MMSEFPASAMVSREIPEGNEFMDVTAAGGQGPSAARQSSQQPLSSVPNYTVPATGQTLSPSPRVVESGGPTTLARPPLPTHTIPSHPSPREDAAQVSNSRRSFNTNHHDVTPAGRKSTELAPVATSRKSGSSLDGAAGSPRKPMAHFEVEPGPAGASISRRSDFSHRSVPGESTQRPSVMSQPVASHGVGTEMPAIEAKGTPRGYSALPVAGKDGEPVPSVDRGFSQGIYAPMGEEPIIDAVPVAPNSRAPALSTASPGLSFSYPSPVTELVACWLASATVLVAGSVLRSQASNFFIGWAIAVSSVSLLATTPLLCIVGPKSFCASLQERVTPFMGLISLALVSLWVAGTGVLTFKSPFQVSGNGFFAAWVALISVWMLMLESFPILKQPFESLILGGGVLLGLLLLMSIVALIQAAAACGDGAFMCSTWVLICSGVSVFVCILFLVPKVSQLARNWFKWIAVFFVLWWLGGAIYGTFVLPFQFTGNGYFASWTAVGISLVLVQGSWGLTIGHEQVLDKVSRLTGDAPRELLVVFIASIIVLIAASASCGSFVCTGWNIWAIICSVASILACSTVIAMKLLRMRDEQVESLLPKLAFGLVLLWVVGTGIMTFKDPFRITGNGYFAAWVALSGSILLLLTLRGMQGPLATAASPGSEVPLLTLASAVLLLQSLIDIGSGSVRIGSSWIIAMIVSCTSLAIGTCFILARDRVRRFMGITGLLLGLLWAIAVGVLTFGYPYTFTGNGYFSCWGGFACSVVLSYKHYWELRRGAAGVPPPSKEGAQPPPEVLGAPEGGAAV